MHARGHFDCGTFQSSNQYGGRIIECVHTGVQLHGFAIRQSLGTVEVP